MYIYIYIYIYNINVCTIVSWERLLMICENDSNS